MSRLVSILGDSISTYPGHNPPGYAVYYDEWTQRENGMSSVSDTWWDIVISRLGAELLINNSYSGSKVSGYGFPSAWTGRRIDAFAADPRQPDMILIYIGFNDFGCGADIDRYLSFDTDAPDNYYFEDAYDIMLGELRSRYPDAAIICGTIMRTDLRAHDNWDFPESFGGIALEEYNEAIRSCAVRNGCITADLASLDMRYETLDGTHPTADGHRTIAGAWTECLNNLGFSKELQ